MKEAFQMAFVFTKGHRQVEKSIQIQPIVKEGVMKFSSAFCLLLPLAKSIWEVSPLEGGLQLSIFSSLLSKCIGCDQKSDAEQNTTLPFQWAGILP